jgi:hypothetical protein
MTDENTTRSRHKLSRNKTIIFASLIIVLAVATVVSGVIRQMQLANLTECTNSAFEERDRIQLEVNKSNREVVNARRQLFTILTDIELGINIPDDVIKEARADYEVNVEDYYTDTEVLDASIRNAYRCSH